MQTSQRVLLRRIRPDGWEEFDGENRPKAEALRKRADENTMSVYDSQCCSPYLLLERQLSSMKERVQEASKKPLKPSSQRAIAELGSIETVRDMVGAGWGVVALTEEHTDIEGCAAGETNPKTGHVDVTLNSSELWETIPYIWVEQCRILTSEEILASQE